VDFLVPPLRGFSLGDRQLWVPALPMVPGGNAANFAFGLSALGARVGLAACLGNDPISGFLAAELRRRHIASFVKFRKGLDAGRTVAIAHADGTRQLITYNGSNLAFSPGDIAAKVLEARHVHRAGYWWTPRLQGRASRILLKKARDRGAETSLDIATEPEGWTDRRRGLVLDVLPEVTVFFANEDEVRGVFRTRSLEAAAKEALALGVEVLAIHRGAKGSTVSGRGWRVNASAFRVVPRNPTGCGDLFNAGFVLGRLRGWDPERSARFGNAVAAAHLERIDRPYPALAAVRRRFRVP
jgi:sugar/nucleoside kinase (ribokinase family)